MYFSLINKCRWLSNYNFKSAYAVMSIIHHVSWHIHFFNKLKPVWISAYQVRAFCSISCSSFVRSKFLIESFKSGKMILFKHTFQRLVHDETSSVGDLKGMVKNRLLGCFGNKHISSNGQTGHFELINITSELLLQITCLLNFSKWADTTSHLLVISTRTISC